jgi:chaperonin cofactor prefoldin
MELASIVLAICAFLATLLTSILINEIRALRKSVEVLNERVAVVIAKTEAHDYRLDRLETHIYAPA